MKKRVALLSTHLGVCVTQHEANRGEEIALARAIVSDDDIMLRGERLDDSLLFVAMTEFSILLASLTSGGHQPFEALNNHLLDEHGDAPEE